MDDQKNYFERAIETLDKFVDLSAKEKDKDTCEALAEKARIIYEQYPKSEDIGGFYAKILSNVSLKQTKVDELKKTAEKLERLHENFSDSQLIAEAFAKILFNVSLKQTELKELERTAEKLEKLHENFSDSQLIAKAFAMFLFNLSLKQTKLKELERTVEKLQILQQHFHDSSDIALLYAKILSNVSLKQTKADELKKTAEKLERLHENFSDSQLIAEAFANILFNLSIEQTEANQLERISERLQKLLEKFSDSQLIAETFAMFLFNVSTKQTELKELERTAEKLEKLHEKFSDSLPIAEAFAMFLFNVSLKQTELKELETTVEKLQILQQQFQKSEIIAFIYSMSLAGLPVHQAELGERLQTTEIIKNLYEQFSKFMLQHFDDLFFHNDNVCDSEEFKLFNFILKEGLLKNTKYAILENWVKSYDENSDELKTLLSIYQLVQKIKYQLGLKDEDKNQMLKFGHYTKGSTFQIMLDQGEDDKKDFSVSGKTRLYNANYMNDPEEGIVIEQILGLDRREVLEPSSWFLMSFTNKTDDLAMWSQYGDDAKGVCLILRENDFSRFTSFNDVSWRKEGIPLVEPMNELNNIKPTVATKEEEKRSKSEKNENAPKGNRDYLYRIAYVKNIDKDIELEQTELFDKSEIEDLAKMLKNLKGQLGSGSKITSNNFQDAISECIEEIRYLFKSVDYKYENELRILRYANLDPSNDKIKIDKESGIGKLYVERDNPIQIEEVIFGPKFPNPEYITPLLKLLDNDIKYKKSTIKFR